MPSGGDRRGHQERHQGDEDERQDDGTEGIAPGGLHARRIRPARPRQDSVLAEEGIEDAAHDALGRA